MPYVCLDRLSKLTDQRHDGQNLLEIRINDKIEFYFDKLFVLEHLNPNFEEPLFPSLCEDFWKVKLFETSILSTFLHFIIIFYLKLSHFEREAEEIIDFNVASIKLLSFFGLSNQLQESMIFLCFYLVSFQTFQLFYVIWQWYYFIDIAEINASLTIAMIELRLFFTFFLTVKV